MKVKEESEKVGLKLNIQKTKIMASSPITSQQIDGETMETVKDFILGVCKSLQMVTAAMKLKDACSWKKNYDQQRRHIKKQRHYFTRKGHLVKSMVFPILCVQLFVTLWTVAHEGPPSMGFFRQEYWSVLHALLQEIFLTQVLNSHLLCPLPWQASSLLLVPPGKPQRDL